MKLNLCLNAGVRQNKKERNEHVAIIWFLSFNLDVYYMKSPQAIYMLPTVENKCLLWFENFSPAIRL